MTNRVAKDRVRITHEFGIGYGDDIDGGRTILVEEAPANGAVLDRPAPTVGLVELADSAVVLRARF